jgi:hypothetical protein
MAPERLLVDTLDAEEPQAGAEVEDDRIPARALDGDAGGVAAVALDRVTGARGRSTYSEEGDVHLSATP